MLKKKVLICPLNWGLGHATRCIPVIRTLVQRGHEVHIASDGVALGLLRAEFPGLTCIELPGYGIHYKGKNLIRSLFLQIPSMMDAMRKEKKRIKKYVAEQGIEVIISDNRFGCRSKNCRNIFISHQLKILLKNDALTLSASTVNRLLIGKFDTVWVPDAPPPDNISGKMSDRDGYRNIEYLGPLSRFTKMDLPIKRDFIAVLSGPEPARTQLESLLIRQAALLPYTVLIVRGLPVDAPPLDSLPSHLTCVDYMTAIELNKAIEESLCVISRTGYTTVMDLLSLGKKGILIPTPGQPEQEYLGQQLAEKKRFLISAQKTLNLSELAPRALDDTNTYQGGFESRLLYAIENAGL